jgi:hypothetical protein
MTAPDWTKRVRPVLNSRHLSVVLIVFLLIANGLALFLVDDAAGKTPFFSNIFVWWIGAHSVFGLTVSLTMAISLWQWKMEQLGLFLTVFGFGVLNLLLSSYLSIATYSTASVFVKVTLWVILVGNLFYFSWGNFNSFSRAWHDEELRKYFLLEKDDHFIFYQLGEVEVREKTNFRASCQPIVCVVFVLAGLATYPFRSQLTAYFEVNWIPLAYAIMMAPLATIGAMMITLGWQYMLYSMRVSRRINKQIYLDDMSKLPS